MGEVCRLLYKDRVVADRGVVDVLAGGVAQVQVLALTRIDEHAHLRLTGQPGLALVGIQAQVTQGVCRVMAGAGDLAHLLHHGLARGVDTRARGEDDGAARGHGAHELRDHRGHRDPVGQQREDEALGQAHLSRMR